MRLVRLRGADRARITLQVDDVPVQAFDGDTLLTAMLSGDARRLNDNDFGGGPRAGFCLMGACQECRVRVDGLGSVRACVTPASSGMSVRRR